MHAAFTIAPLDHRNAAVAQQIHTVLVPAYAQEARLLQAGDFPPLRRCVADIQAEEGFYLGAQRGDTLLGALALGPDDEPGQLLITTLVVHPDHQRQGVARALMADVLRRGAGAAFAVSTGADNAPALALYQGLGFTVYRHGSIGPDALALVKLRRPADTATPAPTL